MLAADTHSRIRAYQVFGTENNTVVDNDVYVTVFGFVLFLSYTNCPLSPQVSREGSADHIVIGEFERAARAREPAEAGRASLGRARPRACAQLPRLPAASADDRELLRRLQSAVHRERQRG